MNQLPEALQPLSQFNQFILWQRVPRVDGRVDKVPISARSMLAHDAHDPTIWLDADTALAVAGGLGPEYGVGFTFTDNDPFFFVDIDECATPGEGNGWNTVANEMCQAFTGAAVEVSQSGTGLHIIGCGWTNENRKCKADHGFDIYTNKRFVALTGLGAVGSVWTDHTTALQSVAGRYLSKPQHLASTEWTTEADPTWSPLTDTQVLQKAIGASSAAGKFGGRATFVDLWTADGDALGRHFPCDRGAREFDSSQADASLAQHLAFWAGNNCEAVERLMRMSALLRDKWDSRAEYLERTILRAVGLQEIVYTAGSREPTPVAASPVITAAAEKPVNTENPLRAAPSTVTGYQLMTTDQQLEYFKGCFYVQSVHRALVPSGAMLKSDQFRATYGGYEFTMDSTNSKTTKNAWEAFTESQAIRHPKVSGLRFRPELEPGTVIEEHEAQWLNSYKPRPGKRTPGDVGPFLRHVEKLLPVETDREILLSYMASCVQRPGIKAQWAPVIQGAEGNGKTALYNVLEHAVGEEYCHQVDPKDIGSKFNAWIDRKLICCIEEIRTAGRVEVADALKPLITNGRVPIQGKGADQTTGDNCANFLLFSNHKDAVLKTRDGRRYCMLYTAQQSIDDIRRDGMGGRYFSEFYEWLRNGGFEYVAEYLHTRSIDVDILLDRAPNTSSTLEAIAESLGPAEQAVLEATQLEEPGFRGDLVCTTAAGDLLHRKGRRMSPRAIAGVLKAIGFEKHPALAGSQGKILIDGTRRRIYVKTGSLAASIGSQELVRKHWQSSQMAQPTGVSGAVGTLGNQ